MICVMAVTLTTKMRIAGWDETPVEEFDDGSKLTRALVRLSDGADGPGSGSVGMLAFYRPDGNQQLCHGHAADRHPGRAGRPFRAAR